MTNPDGEFVPPPEAPVFEPTPEEFKDPMAYIAKIRPIAEQTGICKIRPPPDWQPPFAVDVENFKFTPRVQRLNELEATTRIKLNFLDQIAKFWDLQGSRLKIPNIEKKALDLYNLYKFVHDEGGMEQVCRDRKWAKVASRMGYAPMRTVGSLLRQHYERILYPYDVFQSGANLGDINLSEDSEDCDKKDRDYVPHGIPSRQAIKPPHDRSARRSKRHGKEPAECLDVVTDDDVDYTTNNELRKLQFYGAGPKMPGYCPKGSGSSDEMKDECCELKEERKPKPVRGIIEQIVCHTCGRGDDEESMLLCDGCDDSYHTFCLLPPLPEIPRGDWRCPRCVAAEVRKPQEAFGFEQARREYTLQDFGEMADKFKSSYFSMPVHMISTETVEKEFWRIVAAVDEDVTVEYGADLHSVEHGSGFPTKNSDLLPGDEVSQQHEKKSRKNIRDSFEYMNCGWNLNNLPVVDGSVLRHINADISGMKIPWMYVGMCFATFCWHNEDHWSYSINYLHWGEPKTWYGVPGGKAEVFEDAMRCAAPELFQAQPDLLHQLVTIMNPNILQASGVPIYRTDQSAGEFVITFPRSYHAGFNQGYNFAEAVNFAPADWLPIGRVCVSHYSMLRRFCVFSHDELVCKMAANPEHLDISLAASTYQDMLKMVETEREQRRCLLEWGITDAEREAFELLPDDERQCDYCKTTCFLSAVTCSCNGSKLVCIPHRDHLCDCPPSNHCLRYRYTLDELPVMLHRLKVRAESFDNWAIKVKAALEATEDEDKLELSELKELVQEAEEKRFPPTELLQSLTKAVQESEKTSSVAQQLLSKKVRTRNRQSQDAKYTSRLTLDELQVFYEQLSKLPCVIKESAMIRDLVDRVVDFQSSARDLLTLDEMGESWRLEKLLEAGLSLDMDLPEIPQLKQKVQQAQWLEEVQATLLPRAQSEAQPEALAQQAERDPPTLEELRRLLEAGVAIPPHPVSERALAELQGLLTASERWEERAKTCLQAQPRQTLAACEALAEEGVAIPVHLPSLAALKDAIRRAKEWGARAEALQGTESKYPYIETLENLLQKGRPIPVCLEQLPQLESQVAAAKAWKERTARTFLKKNSAYSLLEVLSPRRDIGIYQVTARGKKKRLRDGPPLPDKEEPPEIKTEDTKDPAIVVAAFKESVAQELESMKQLRAHNLRKRLEDTGQARYCTCHNLFGGHMLQCELCKDWFHASCVPTPKARGAAKSGNSGGSSSPGGAAGSSSPGSSVFSVASAKESKFLCPACLRSRRPRLETILSLLVSLQKLPVRLPEGEALQCLTERAMSWQDRARQALATDELAAALAKLSVLSQKMVEQAAREKTEKIISAELLRAASKPELQPHLQSVAQSAFGGLRAQEKNGSSSDVEATSVPEDAVPTVAAEQEVSLSQDGADDGDVKPTVEDEKQPPCDSYSSMEHAYSTASKNNAVCNPSPRKHARKSPLVPRQVESPVLELSAGAKTRLEALLTEGDLLEVSLDETGHIWRILQATKPPRDPLSPFEAFPEFEDYTEASKRPDKRTKKRKVEQAEATVKPRPKPKLQKRMPTKDEAGNPSTSAGQGASAAADSSTTKAASGVKKVSRGAADTGKQPERKVRPIKKVRREDSGSGGAASSDKVVKRRRVAHRPQNASSSAETADVADDVCSAPACVQPQGEAVNWVQCDGGCEQWFHLLCVGLSMNEVKDSEDYYCPQCSQPDVKASSRSGQQDVSGNGELPELPDETVDSGSPAAAEAEDSNGAAVSSISEPPTGAALLTAAV
ncbi:lysine-specific demethylase 5A isoform X1 [Rhipicephalus sanguineus]|uniref:lysine-specific demethylase 5A isoform X1 n=1 Tax=Rhipicephalus sanguineus TaxID=34632 RepID=UPI0020C30B52|nr:lysine-specific demethylase 5A isoform X1 [Rhipicephalus sanguineus]